MRRRILVALVSAVTLALLLAGLTTTLLLSQDTRHQNRLELERRVVRMAAKRLLYSRNSLVSFSETFGLSTAAVLPLTGEPTAIDFVGQPLADSVIDQATTVKVVRLPPGRALSGIVGSVAFAAAPTPDGRRLIVITRPIQSAVGRVAAWLGLAAAASLALVAIAASVIARRITGPLRAAEQTTRLIAGGDLSVRVPIPEGRGDEVGDLARSINQMAAELDRAQKLERQFLLSVSHDLRTPLTSIRGFAEAIAEGTAPDQQRAASVISSEARRLERLVRDLLELAKLDASRFALHLRPTDVTEVVTDSADGFLPAAQREQLSLSVQTEDDLRASADPDRLAQVLANLIENAMKFAHTTVSVSAKRVDSFIEIAVSDDGPGIAAEDLSRIFERLYTSDRRPTRQIGSGLGLTIVHELLTAMNATVVPTTSATGTTFTVRLRALL